LKKLTKKLIKSLLKPRSADTNKGDYGHALIVAGFTGKMGSAVIAAKACMRTGCGLLTVNIPYNEFFVLQSSIPEAMLVKRSKVDDHLDKYSALGIGPGIGVSQESTKRLTFFLKSFKKPIILDADALNIIASKKLLLESIPQQTILTPHAKEYDRLFGVNKTNEDRIQNAIYQAKKFNLIIVLKGHHTVITNGEEAFINVTGNAGLAKAGSGDALSGMVCSLLSQGYPAFDAAKIAVYLHGVAADIALNKQSVESMLITDVIECIGKAFKSIGIRRHHRIYLDETMEYRIQ
jgi:hydroxyethylthiazole kinase-like uncharacterized protein yjeF